MRKLAGKFMIVMVLLYSGSILFATEKMPLSSVIKVFTVKSKPNYHQPWQNYPQTSGSGSGCYIGNKRIITNAHIVADQTFIMVRKQGNPRKFVAEVISVGHECDLALIKVKNEEFYEGLKAIEIGELPDLQDTVSVLGYPIGGNNISVTEGVVSRIEPSFYSHSRRYLLSAQIDAAINPGNSGGPVVKDGKIVGVAFQGNRGAENIGYMVPSPIIKHFLKDVEDNVFDGFPDIDINIIKMENPDLRKWAKMKPDQTGVLVSYITQGEKDKNMFKLHDVIMEVDGVKIANNATIPFRKDEVIFFGNLIWEKYVGDTCRFKLLRDGKELEINYKLGIVKKLVPPPEFDVLPTYYIFGGLVFIPLTQNYLHAWGRSWTKRAPRALLNFLDSGEITKERNQIVVLTKVLADDVNIGYQNVAYLAVKTINGEKIKNIRDLISRIESLDSEFIELEMENHQLVVLNIKRAKKATSLILRRYRIASDRSLNLMNKP